MEGGEEGGVEGEEVGVCVDEGDGRDFESNLVTGLLEVLYSILRAYSLVALGLCWC